jgi:hypothetical protein|tara:strand:- start:2239 stop:2541 length:303 start_codon:yes stop_codon:yes gene_type:complete
MERKELDRVIKNRFYGLTFVMIVSMFTYSQYQINLLNKTSEEQINRSNKTSKKYMHMMVDLRKQNEFLKVEKETILDYYKKETLRLNEKLLFDNKNDNKN